MKTFQYGFLTLACAGALLASSAALAGWKDVRPVWINNSVGFALGSLGDVRNSADPVQEIDCSSTPSSGGCTAIDSSGQYVECNTTDPNLLTVIRSLKNDSYVVFQWDSNRNCISISVFTASWATPKLP